MSDQHKFDSFILSEWEDGHIHSIILTDLRDLHHAEIAKAVKAERERCVRIVDNEEEYDGQPSADVLEDISQPGNVVEAHRMTVRITKRTIRKAILEAK